MSEIASLRETSEVILVRHGEDTDNKNGILNGHRDNNLTNLGIKQALEVGKELRSYNPDIIVSSPLKRAKHTALIISDRAGVEIVKESRLIMERDLGILTGKPVDHICKYADGTFEVDDFTYFLKAKGAEEIPSCHKRAKKFLLKLSGYDSDSIVVVAHGGIGQMIRAVYNGWSWKKGLKFSHLENGEAMLLGGS